MNPITCSLTHIFKCVNANQKMRFQMQITIRWFDKPNAIVGHRTRIGHIHHCDCTAERFNQTAAMRVNRFIRGVLCEIAYGCTVAHARSTVAMEMNPDQMGPETKNRRTKYFTRVSLNQFILFVIKLKGKVNLKQIFKIGNFKLRIKINFTKLCFVCFLLSIRISTHLHH